jgi:F0F1-type ATP synthase delta subunit
MRYSLQNYAEAFAAAVREAGADQQDTVARNFLALLGKSGDDVYAENIVKATERLLRKRDGGREVVVESARPLEISNRNLLSEIATAKDAVTLRVNPDLVAGVRIFIDEEMEFDGSLKGKLDKMLSA